MDRNVDDLSKVQAVKLELEAIVEMQQLLRNLERVGACKRKDALVEGIQMFLNQENEAPAPALQAGSRDSSFLEGAPETSIVGNLPTLGSERDTSKRFGCFALMVVAIATATLCSLVNALMH